jgi:hypothetical protein
MKIKLLSTLFIAGLLSLNFSSCDSSDDDENNNNGLAGVWQNTVSGVSQTTINLDNDNTFEAVEADYLLEECEDQLFVSDITRWWNDDDSLYISTNFANQSDTMSIAYILDGNNLIITDDEDGSDEIFTRINDMIDCDHYDWESGSGVGFGTMTADVNGTQTDFSSIVLLTTDSGIFGILGNNTVGQITFSLTSLNAGTYSFGSAGNLASYIPNINDDTTIYMATSGIGSGTLEISSYANNTAVGTFEFTGMNFSDQTTVSITNGQFNIGIN